MIQLFNEQLIHLTGAIPGNKQGEPKYLLAVSGGRDSMCLANLFFKSKHNFSIAHANFSLRGKESDADEQLVRDWADTNSVECFVKRFDTNEYAQTNSISIQMAARDLRYNWFDELIRNNSFDYLVIAHNLNDKVETLFINLIRGTGIKGLTGIKERSGYIIRPLIKFTREMISQYVAQEGVPYRDDSSNDKNYYSRNRIRNNVFPEIEKINPSFLKTIGRNIDLFSEATEILEDYKINVYNKVVDSSNSHYLKIDIQKIKEEKYAQFWLYSILENFGFNSSQCADIFEAFSGISGKIFESPTHKLVKDREFLLLYETNDLMSHSNQDIVITFEDVLCEKIVTFGEQNIVFKQYPIHLGFTAESSHSTHFLDLGTVKFPLIIRRWNAGDSFMPLGMSHFKKISDFYTDLKIDIVSKSNNGVIIADGQIICLPALRIDNRYRITQDTKSVLEITIY